MKRLAIIFAMISAFCYVVVMMAQKLDLPYWKVAFLVPVGLLVGILVAWGVTSIQTLLAKLIFNRKPDRD